MPGKTVTISARIDQQDAEFLATVAIPKATTPSDKLRHILAAARQWQSVGNDYDKCLERIEDWIAPALHRWRTAENTSRQHSELVRLMAEWLPEALAFLIATVPQQSQGNGKDVTAGLDELEEGLTNRAFTMIDAILRLGVTGRDPCYDPNAVGSRIEPILELAHFVDLARTQRRERSQ
jgi:hypothetical protein